jgi:hypothetical protein
MPDSTSTSAIRDPAGPIWVDRFPGSNDPAKCADPFRSKLLAFLAALKAAGATVSINATLRPPERAYLMHCAWDVAKNMADPRTIPPMSGVPIDWVLRDALGQPDLPKSRTAARLMVQGFGMVAQAALASRHTQGFAVDMDISWLGSLSIARNDGQVATIDGDPHTGMNHDLADVGATYGVIKAVFAGDPPHWSNDGH